MEIYDVLIAGGGPAGLTAALNLRRAGKSVLVLERETAGGQIVYAPLVENYPGLPGLSGADFAAKLTEQAEALGAELAYAEVLGLSRTPEGRFQMDTDAGIYTGRAVILACGAKPRALGLPGEAELVGAGISYCAVCDGAFFAGKDVAVIGGGDTALQEALFLSGVCRSVALVVRRDRFRGEALRGELLRKKENVRVLFRRVPEAFLKGGDGAVRGLRLRNLETGETEDLPAEGVFAAVGREPENQPFAALVSLDENGYIAAGEDTETGCPGLFAAGDCRRKTLRQLTTAAADGAAAAHAAAAWLDRLP